MKNIKISKKISANKIAEYVDAKPSRQETLIRQRIKDDGHASNYYALASAAISRLLTLELGFTQAAFVQQESLIEVHPGYGSHPKALIQNNLMALRCFRRMCLADGTLPAGSYRKATLKLPVCNLGGLLVSNAMDIELVVKQRKRVKYGAVKLYFSKDHHLSDFSGKILSSMLYRQFVGVRDYGSVSRQHVVVVDVFSEKVFEAPASHTRLNNELLATSRGIIARWDSLLT